MLWLLRLGNSNSNIHSLEPRHAEKYLWTQNMNTISWQRQIRHKTLGMLCLLNSLTLNRRNVYSICWSCWSVYFHIFVFQVLYIWFSLYFSICAQCFYYVVPYFPPCSFFSPSCPLRQLSYYTYNVTSEITQKETDK